MSGLLSETQLDAEQREYSTTIARSGDALLTIINDILDFSKIEAGRMELELAPFDVRESIESVVDLIGPIAQRERHRLELEPPGLDLREVQDVVDDGQERLAAG